MMAFEKFNGEGDRQNVEIEFDLQQDVTFRKDSFSWSEVIIMRLIILLLHLNTQLKKK